MRGRCGASAGLARDRLRSSPMVPRHRIFAPTKKESLAMNFLLFSLLTPPATALIHPAHTTCPGGGIGRRARFRSVCRKAWRFESSPGHHKQKPRNPLGLRGFCISRPIFRPGLLQDCPAGGYCNKGRGCFAGMAGRPMHAADGNAQKFYNNKKTIKSEAHSRHFD